MGISLVLQNHDEIYREQLHATPILIDFQRLTEHEYFSKALSNKHRNALAEINKPQEINYFRDSTIEDKDKINRTFYTRYVSEKTNTVIEDIPSCQCGEFNTYKNLGCVCNECGTIVSSNRSMDLHPLVWIAAPEGIPALINPTAYRIIAGRFEISKFDVIRWIMDYNYTAPGKEPIAVEQLERMEIPRGIINFYHHFDTIIETLFGMRSLSKGPNTAKLDEELRTFIKNNRDKIFSKHIPMPNKTLLVVESTNFATYMDPKLSGIIDALWLMVGIDSEHSNLTLKQKEMRVIKALAQIAEYHTESDKTSLAQKGGIFRRHVFGFRAWLSFRTVISSITEPHNLRDIYIPWSTAVTCFQYHLINKLSKRLNPNTGKRFTPHEIDLFIEGHVNKWHPLLREIFDELLAETPNGRGIPCLKNRNPSLYRNSIQKVYITKIKDDITDVTTSISILTVRPLNAKKIRYLLIDILLLAITLVIVYLNPL
ncbi:MAG: hypothetical protein M0R77_00880 [Gammaproteobacteria bacterium]|nr:hypothetical protein [Acholeplasmataceae bacterium]MCK9529109.1 hypothetical protein [Gammaproteobacteria bacterium]